MSQRSRLAMSLTKKFTATVGLSTVGSFLFNNSSKATCDDKKKTEDEAQNRFYTFVKNIKEGINSLDSYRSQKPETDGLQMFSPKKYFGKFSRNGYPIARIGIIDIDTNYENIISAWCDHSKRKFWDQQIYSYGPITSLKNTFQVFEKPVSVMIPPRDFVFQIHKSSGAVVGINDYTAVSLVSIDASTDIPQSWLFVRGHFNSVLILQPKGPNSTHVIYAIEKDPGGWAFLSPAIANIIAGNNPVIVLRYLKRYLENTLNDNEENNMSVEAIAKKRVNDRLAAEEKIKQGVSIITNPEVSKEDLQITISTLESRLNILRRTESTEKIDLTELKNRIIHDLESAKKNLANHKSK